MIRRLNMGHSVPQSEPISLKHKQTYPHSGLYKLLPFIILDRCRWSNHFVNEVRQRLCLNPLPEELRAIIKNVEIYKAMSEVEGDSDHSLPQRRSAIRGSIIG